MIFAILSLFKSSGMTKEVEVDYSSYSDSMINSGIKNQYLYNELYNFNNDSLQIPIGKFCLLVTVILYYENGEHYLLVFSNPRMAEGKYVGYTIINDVTFAIHIDDSTYYEKLIDTGRLIKGLPQHIIDKYNEDDLWDGWDLSGKKYKIHNQDSIEFIDVHYL